MVKKLKVSLIGLGKQNLQDNLNPLLLNNNLKIISICDTNIEILKNVSSSLDVSIYEDYEDLIKYEKPDAVFIALPHNSHFSATKICLESGINVFKEKPIALNYEEAKILSDTAKNNKKIFYTTAQRRFSKLYNLAKQKLRSIGDIYSVDMTYTMHLQNLENSWRSSKSKSGGGVLIDMGYHFVDILLWFFDYPDKVYSSISEKNLKNQNYDTEDTIKIIFEYNNRNVKNNIVFMNLSRTYPEKQENIIFIGTNGYMVLTKNNLKIFNRDNEIQEEFSKDLSENLFAKQIDYFIDLVNNNTKNSLEYLGSPNNHINHIKLIDYIYKQNN